MGLRSWVVLGVVGVMLTAGCVGDREDGAGGSSAPGAAVSEGEQRERVSAGSVEEVVRGIDGFAFELSRLVGSQEDNLVYSPASIVMAFAMAHAGASDETRATLEAAFGMPGAPQLYETAHELLEEIHADTDDAVTLAVANGGWAQDGRPIGDDYLDTLERYFGAGLETLDLQGRPDASRAHINDWVAEQTRDRIPELLPDGFINPKTVYLLVNTVYLDAGWEEVFGKYPTESADFLRPDGVSVEVEMMRNAELRGRYLIEDDLEVVELPYAGGDLVMRVLVPDDLATTRDLLDATAWDRISRALEPGVVDVSLPKWDVESDIDLAAPLGELGIEIPGGDYGRIAPGVFLGQAIHGANITVEEDGTEAAAGTALGFQKSGPPPPDATIRADRPFLYTIVHKPTGFMLFAGHIVDPAA